MRKRLEAICSKLGRPFEDFLHPPPHSVPGEDCSCGFYAMKDLESMLRFSAPGLVLGRVKLAGKVIEYTSGYRAECARIDELISTAADRRSVAKLALRLGLPLASTIPPWIDGPSSVA
jgi:hypothetical protein